MSKDNYLTKLAGHIKNLGSYNKMLSYFAILFIGALIYLVLTTKTPDDVVQETTKVPDDVVQETIILPSLESEEGKIIVTYKDKRYDVTEFALSHPGGKDVLLENKGKDVEETMREIGHSEVAYKMLDKFLIS